MDIFHNAFYKLVATHRNNKKFDSKISTELDITRPKSYSAAWVDKYFTPITILNYDLCPMFNSGFELLRDKLSVYKLLCLIKCKQIKFYNSHIAYHNKKIEIKQLINNFLVKPFNTAKVAAQQLGLPAYSSKIMKKLNKDHQDYAEKILLIKDSLKYINERKD